jgi:surface antigen
MEEIMLTRTSTIRSKLAVCAAAVALVAGILAAPAAAETKHKRWLPNHNPAARPGNVEQGGRQVNHRYDGHDRGRPPVWQNQRREHGRKRGRQAREYPQYPPGYGNRDRRHDGRHNPPPPRHADRDHRHGDDRRHKYKGDKHKYSYGGGHNHDYDRHRRKHRPTRHDYRYSFYYVQPYPRVIYYPVPYHTHGYGETHDYYDQGRQAATCGGGYSDGGRYVMGGSHEPGGTILGGIVGAAIGSQIGGGNGRLAAVGVGTLIGALVGRDIGRTMDDTDRAYATGSFGHAMEYAPTCSSITWNNPRSGSNGTVTPTQTYEPEPGRYCREFQQEVMIGGQVQDAYGTACRQPDGSWEIVTE